MNFKIYIQLTTALNRLSFRTNSKYYIPSAVVNTRDGGEKWVFLVIIPPSKKMTNVV